MSLNIWTVYDSPLDFPGKFVARKWVLDRPTGEHIVRDTLDEIRDALPPGLCHFRRADEDEPHIVETWF